MAPAGGYSADSQAGSVRAVSSTGVGGRTVGAGLTERAGA